ncbi:MAG: hypothetical protein ACJA06_002192 [Halocynthiibacter sp.]|jgi:hypothetical protein
MITSLAKTLPPRLSRIVAIIALAFYLLGTIGALYAQNSGAFHRFGSLGVAAAILFFTDRLLQIELKRQSAVERILHEYGLELEVLKEGVAPQDIPREGFLTDYLREEGHFSGLRQAAERTNARNIILLTLATLQWGFGDLAMRLVLGWIG